MKLLLLLLSCHFAFAVSGQGPYSVVINEIMADPSPAVGLPELEWIELYNASDKPVSLRNWRLADGAGTSGPFPDFILEPHQYLILCAGSARAGMEVYGQTLAIPSFPSLDNTGEPLSLRSADDHTIHAVRYSNNWQSNMLKKEGGWSLEMTDAGNPCSGSTNWRSSVNIAGGTPGTINSTAAPNPDNDPPTPLRTYPLGNNRLAILFTEPLDSIQAVSPGHFEIDHGIKIISVACTAPFFDEVIVETNHPLDSLLSYVIRINGIKDCRQNEMPDTRSVKAGLFSATRCVINEVMFDPRPGAFDYVEIYNCGPGIADAAQLYLANRNNGQAGTPSRLTNLHFAIFPGDHIAVTENAASLVMNYTVKDRETILEVAALPSLPDDKGTVVLLGFQGLILDEVSYTKDWHHQLIGDPEGVALERIDPLAVSNERSNWHSAASVAGYGTPGYINSQSRTMQHIEALIDVYPKIFSPDNDGRDDLTSIIYKMEIPGFIANVFIYDATGRQVKHLVRNAMLDSDGYWHWNGCGETGQPLPIGIYIVQVDLFNAQGTKRRFRKTVVLAKRLKQ